MPQVEAWEKVLVDADFPTSTHGAMGCRTCHGGPAGENTFEVAHEGVVTDPSEGDAAACATCHSDIVANVGVSLHATQNGYFTAYHARAGAALDDAGYAEMFAARCASCHGTCGQCHISRPGSVRGGLVSGHQFRKTPSQKDNCTACHGSRVGEEFRGEHPGIPEDVHWRSGMNCTACHDGDELHGDGTTPDDRYANDAGPQCTSCHPDAESASSDVTHHAIHGGKVACQVCHSLEYKNCYSCHVELDAQGLRFPSELDFRIGRNPNPNERHPYDYVVVRHIPVAPDTFEPWGLELENYAGAPTWKMATPHNIQKNTPQTESCDNCHGSLDLFLTTSYVQELIERGVMTSEELDANAEIVVDEIPDMQ